MSMITYQLRWSESESPSTKHGSYESSIVNFKVNKQCVHEHGYLPAETEWIRVTIIKHGLYESNIVIFNIHKHAVCAWA